MKVFIRVIGISLAIIFLSFQNIGAVGHYPPGGEGVNGAAAPPSCLPIPNNPKTSSFHYQGKFIYYTADEIKDDNGEKALDANLGILVQVNRFVYVKKINATSDWILHLLIPLQQIDLELTVPGGPTIVDDSQSGVGDILLEGAYAIHQKKYDIILAGGLIGPTGNFDTSEPASIGLGFWSMIFSGGLNYKFGEKNLWSASALNRLLINTEQKDTEITPGMEFVSELGIGKTIPSSPTFLITPGLFGHVYRQLTEDTGDAAGELLSQSYGLGLECNFFSLKKAIQVNVRYSQELGAKNEAEGSRFEFKFTKSFF